MKNFSLTQLIGAMGFAYFLGILITLVGPIIESIQIVGLTGFMVLSVLVFIYGTLVKGRKQK